MPPILALFVWLVLLLLLLWFDPAKEPGTSAALWVPLLWMFIDATRLPSQWLGADLGAAGSQALAEGDPLDRAVFLFLIALAVGILITRSFKWHVFFSRNLFLMAYVLFALLSVCWSDFPFVAFKRWGRDLGNYLMILVVLSDPHPVEAVRTLLRRLCYLVIPLSVVMVKYFPEISKHYDLWTGSPSVDGATTSKNMLGVACLIAGLFLFWDTTTRWSERKDRHTKRILAVNFAFMAMTLWLLALSNSATSRVCLAIGGLVVWAVRSSWGQRHRTFIKVMIPATFCLYLILAFGFDLNGQMASQVGRDASLTDRTLIWQAVLGLHTNPLLGTGYESFWLGRRLDVIWAAVGHVNESHNGYLEVYLNLGLIGLFLLVGFLLTSYRRICKTLSGSTTLASFNIALWAVVLFYNMTEAAFRFSLMWMAFLIAAIAVPSGEEVQEQSAARSERTNLSRRFRGVPLETTGPRR
jgi:O-antigen ligase